MFQLTPPTPLCPCGWYADPELRIFDNKYYLYPTVSTAYDCQKYFEAFVSTDLVTWINVGRILDFKDVPWSTNRAAWAPSVGCKDGIYYLYFSAGDGVGIGVASSRSPEGPFVDVLGKPLIGGEMFGAEPIDAMEGIREIPLEQEYVEGPWMMKRRGMYYFMYSVGGWGDSSYAVKYVKADNPLGPFDGPAKMILSSELAIGTSTGHNSAFNIGDDYYIVYHRRPIDDYERDHRVSVH
ncbi:hypothetical protein PAAG_01529 [Paracoccidioides lutzii Pb01]|uniref:Xylosidase/arabinosidase n=1 Tax=Paracoccidioides lutzii (strain ATCC MYA-826 / Pb01) TaxID=502779 RepID=C1GSN4_PARBA|nr:hypothetical protein PAAG_01529 [Paracoccidioides lutzii Pb01]EEH39067.2 hypothetical protein PAAG_01529 [Paracoccidioides lutzii Pb01]